jgi:predicted short-subunit dehydrogenase-like oxidoreductase (DUF2520 family)
MAAYTSVFRENRPATAIIGAGAVGRVLAHRLKERAYPVLATISRTRLRAERLGSDVGATVFSDDVADLPPVARVVALCVPDRAIRSVAEELARTNHPWRETVVFHTSGALPARELSPLAEAGATVLSFHPLQTITAKSTAGSLDDIYYAIEGTPKAIAAGVELASALGGRYLVLTEDVKPRYHLAASVASNFTVVLEALVQEILGTIDIDRETAAEVMRPLIRGTLDNLTRMTPEDALSGPISRGDVDTVRNHGLALRRHLPHLAPFYASMGLEAVRVAVRSGRLDPTQADRMLDLLHKLVTIPIPRASAEAA